MCTDRTAKQHIDNYKALVARKKELEKLIDAEKEWILNESDSRNENKFCGISVIHVSREDIHTSDIKRDLPEVWERYKYINSYRYIR